MTDARNVVTDAKDVVTGAKEQRQAMREHLLYIGGGWRQGGAGTMPATSPSSGEEFAALAVADPADVDDAVTAAAAAWPDWARASAFDRAAWCERA